MLSVQVKIGVVFISEDWMSDEQFYNMNKQKPSPSGWEKGGDRERVYRHMTAKTQEKGIYKHRHHGHTNIGEHFF
jgi:hypothetical protein